MKNYITKNGHEKMINQLNDLTNVDYKNAIKMMQESKDVGNLSESAEYEAAKEYHTNVLNKISALREKIRTSEIIDVDNISIDKIGMLSTVQIKNHSRNQITNWTLVPENEIDIKVGKISFNSPIGQALMGKKEGDIVEVQVPAGLMKLEVLKIEFDYKF